MLFGESSDWQVLVGVGSVVFGGVMFVIRELKELRNELSAKISSLKNEVVRVEDEATRKVHAVHVRVDEAKKSIGDNDKAQTDRILHMKDQMIDIYKSLWQNRSKK